MCSAVWAVHESRGKYGLYHCKLDKYLGRKDTRITCRFAASTGESSATHLGWKIEGFDFIGLLSTFTNDGKREILSF